MRKHRSFLYFLVIALLYTSESWAKTQKQKPTPTLLPTPTATPTETPTSTPTPTPLPPIANEKIYEFDTLWGSKGSALDQLNAPEDIAVSADEKVYIADTGNNRVLVWDSNGNPLQSIGTFGTLATWRSAPQFNHPGGILVLPSKKIFVSDTLNHRVVVMDEKGLVISAWGTQGTENGQFNLPRTLGKDHFGHLWVLDSGNSRVQLFSQLGAFISTWGAFGSEPGLLNQPLGMGLNYIDQTILADTGNFRVQVFNEKGVPVTFEGWYGEGPNQYTEPAGVAVTKSGRIAVADGSDRVEFYNNRFEYIGQWRARDEIINPKIKPHFRGIASDASDRLYITDTQDNVVIRLRPLKPPGSPVIITTPTPPAQVSPYGGNNYPVR